MNATSKLRILIVEDSEDDALLVLRELRRSGYAADSTRVESAGAMRAALAAHAWDLILSDYMIPGFGGLEALRIAKQSGFDLPFILVSNKVSEETLVEAMRAGATDFLMKDRLERLGPVVRRELADAAARRGLKQAQFEWTTAFDAVQDPIFVHDADFRIIRANLAYAALGGVPVAQLIGKPYWEVFPRQDGPLPGCHSLMGKGGMAEDRIDCADGTTYTSRAFTVSDALGKHTFSVHVMQDVTERNRVQQALAKSERHFRSLLENASDLVAVVDVNGTITYISPAVMQLGNYGIDEVLGQNYMGLVHPEDAPAAAAGHAKVIRDPGVLHRSEFRFRKKDGAWTVLESVARNALADPLINGIVINSRDITERKRAQEQVSRYLTQLETAFMSTVEVATNLSEMRDPYTTGHERRVADIAAAIGAAMGFDKRRQEGLRVAGLLHDVGKITVPAEILSKPGRLTPIEYQLAMEHARASYEVLKDVKFPWPVAEVALQHHERMDGSGYPQGLKGDAILLEARIMAVADVVEAMGSHRPYRPGLGIDKALAEIERGRGSVYDPLVVDACLKLFREQGYAIPA